MPRPIIIPDPDRRVAALGGWTLYEAGDSGSILWILFKLIAPAGTRVRKGTLRVFRLAWNPMELRLARGRHAVRLEAEQPAVHAAALAVLQATYTRAWLLRYADEADIEAEAVRLAARGAKPRL